MTNGIYDVDLADEEGLLQAEAHLGIAGGVVMSAYSRNDAVQLQVPKVLIPTWPLTEHFKRRWNSSSRVADSLG